MVKTVALVSEIRCSESGSQCTGRLLNEYTARVLGAMPANTSSQDSISKPSFASSSPTGALADNAQAESSVTPKEITCNSTVGAVWLEPKQKLVIETFLGTWLNSLS